MSRVSAPKAGSKKAVVSPKDSPAEKSITEKVTPEQKERERLSKRLDAAIAQYEKAEARWVTARERVIAKPTVTHKLALAKARDAKNTAAEAVKEARSVLKAHKAFMASAAAQAVKAEKEALRRAKVAEREALRKQALKAKREKQRQKLADQLKSSEERLKRKYELQRKQALDAFTKSWEKENAPLLKEALLEERKKLTEKNSTSDAGADAPGGQPRRGRPKRTQDVSEPIASREPQVKRGRGRPKQAAVEAPVSSQSQAKRRPGRPKSTLEVPVVSSEGKRGRGRPKSSTAAAEVPASPAPKAKRGGAGKTAPVAGAEGKRRPSSPKKTVAAPASPEVSELVEAPVVAAVAEAPVVPEVMSELATAPVELGPVDTSAESPAE